MKNHLLLLLCSFLSITVYAQPSNDDCNDAILITDLNQNCQTYNSTLYTVDTEGSGCGPNLNPPNMWYTFEAVGENLLITLEALADERVVINVFSPLDPANPCDGLTNLFCSQSGEVFLTDLTIGETYYFSVSILDNVGEAVEREFELCITNGDPPVNVDPCAAIDVPMGSCYDGTNYLAFLSPIPISNFSNQCPDNYQSQVWFTTQLSDGNHILEVELGGSGGNPLSGEVFVVVGNFEAGCTSTFIYESYYCGPQVNNIQFPGLDANETYYVLVASAESNEGDFSVCFNEQGPDPCASEHNECEDLVDSFDPVTPPTGGVPIWECVTADCVDNATPFDQINFQPSCGFQFSNSTVWYQVNTDATAVSLNLQLNGYSNFGQFALAVMQLADCDDIPTVFECSVGNPADFNLTDIPVQVNSTYYIAVMDLEDNIGNFDLCLSTLPANIPCNREFHLEEISSNVDDSPIGGPYCPGEEVTFKLVVDYIEVTAANCQWLQAIIPIFGDGWDPSSFQADGEPNGSTGVNSLYGGAWDWYVEGDVDYNVSNPRLFLTPGAHGLVFCSPLTDPNCTGTVLNTGVGLPAGWYAWQSDGMGQTGHPDVDYGDGAGCGNISGPWEVSFTLTAREYPDCSTQPSYSDCRLGMMIFTDGETGSWVNQDCVGQLPRYLNNSLDCSETPDIMAEDAEICSGQTFTIGITSDQDPLQYTWTADAPAGISGAADGTGPVISQTLTNNTNGPLVVTYDIQGKKTACPAISEVEVTVYPDIEIELINQPVMGCALQPFFLGDYVSVSGGKPAYNYTWSTGDTDPNPEVQFNTTTTITLTVSDELGCSDMVTFEIEISELYELEVLYQDSICAYDFPILLTANPLGGVAPHQEFTWILPNGATIETGTDNTLSAEEGGTYIVTVLDDFGCPGQFEFELEVHDVPVIDISTSAIQFGVCEYGNPLDLSVDIINLQQDQIAEVDWRTPTDFTEDVDGLFTFLTEVPGVYHVTVTTIWGCIAVDSVTVDLFPTPTGNEVNIEGCNDVTGMATFDLTNYVDSINTNSDFFVEIYQDMNRTIRIIDLTNVTVAIPTTIYAFTSSFLTGCYSAPIPINFNEAEAIMAFSTGDTICNTGLGTAIFNLTNLEDVVTGGVNTLIIEWFETNSEDMPIADPSAYESGTDTVYARLTDGVCYSGFTPVYLDLSLELEAFDATAEACLGLDLEGIFDLTAIEGDIYGADPATVSFFEDINLSIPIANPGAYKSAAGFVYAILRDADGCISNVATITLTTEEIAINLNEFTTCRQADGTGNFALYPDAQIQIGEDSVLWYEDMAGTQQIINTTNYNSNAKTIYARVVVDGCLSGLTPITLNIEEIVVSAGPFMIEACQNISGSGTFDLTILNDQILNDPNYPDYTVEWFSDAAGTVLIPDPTMMNATTGTTVWVRGVVDGLGCVSALVPVTLNTVLGIPADNASLTTCDQGGGMGTFDLADANSQINAGFPGIKYFTDNAAANEITPLIFTSGSTTIYARVEDGDCISDIVEVVLIVEQQLNPNGISISTCDEGSGEGTFDLTESQIIDGILNGISGTITWFEDAAASVAIPDPTNFKGSDGGIIYAVVTDNDGCVSDPIAIELEVSKDLPAFDASIETCNDGNDMGVFNLNSIDNIVDGGNGFTVEYYEDATGTNVIANSMAYSSGAKVIYAKTFDGPCESEVVEITLVLIPPIQINDIAFDACDDGTGMAIFDLEESLTDLGWNGSNSVLWFEDAAATQAIADPTNYSSTPKSIYVYFTNGSCDSRLATVDLTLTTLVANSIEITTCDLGSGEGDFKLLANESLIATDASQSVRWASDATGTTSITASDTYRSANATIYAQVTDGRCFSPWVEIDLELTNDYVANAAMLRLCDEGNGMATFDLTQMNADITGGLAFDVEYYTDAAGTQLIPSTEVGNYLSGGAVIYARVVDGACASPLTEQNLIVDPLPTISDSTIGRISCDEPMTSIGTTADPNMSYIWTTVDGTITSGTNTSMAEVSSGGTYVLAVTNTTTNCSSTAEFVVEDIRSLPVVELGPDMQIGCEVQEVTIGTTNTSSGADFELKWYLDGVLLESNSPQIMVVDGGLYTLEVTDLRNNCTNSSTVTVINDIAELQSPLIAVKDVACFGETSGCITLIQANGGQPPYEISVDGVNYFPNQICNLEAGAYTMFLRDAIGCQVEVDTVIKENSLLSVEIDAPILVEYGETAVMEALITPADRVLDTVLWTSTAILDYLSRLEVEVDDVTEEFNLRVTVIDENGCIAEDVLTVHVYKDFSVFVPNAFSPNNNDNVNDRMIVYGDPEIVTNVKSFQIFARSGEKVFERYDIPVNDPSQGWDGTFRGDLMTPQVFTYWTEVLYVDSTTAIIQGDFTLME